MPIDCWVLWHNKFMSNLGKHWKIKNTSKMKHFGIKNPFYGKKHTEKTKIKISEKRKGKCLGNTNGFKKGNNLGNINGFLKGQDAWNKGKENLFIKGEKNPNWNGGISKENETIRGSIKYRIWVDSVFAKDNCQCKKCNEVMMPYKLTAHHILNFAIYKELRFDINNGITFCKNCHKLFHKIYGNRINTKEQIDEFLCHKFSNIIITQLQ